MRNEIFKIIIWNAGLVIGGSSRGQITDIQLFVYGTFDSKEKLRWLDGHSSVM